MTALKRIKDITARVAVGTCLVLVGGALNVRLHAAFNSVQKFTMTATVVTGGTPVTPVQIAHTPLGAVSSVSKKAIVQGEAGTTPSSKARSFPSRILPLGGSNELPLSAREIRIVVRYRITPNGLPLGSVPGSEVTLPPVEGPDPTPFAFEVAPEAVIAGTLEYQIIANRLQLAGGKLVPISTTTIPSDLNNWIAVGVAAGQSRVMGTGGGRFALENGNPNVGRAALDIPAGIIPEGTTVSFSELPAEETITPSVRTITTSVNPPNPQNVGHSQAFSIYQVSTQANVKGVMQLTLLYPDFEFFGNGQNGILDGTEDVSEETASIIFWDGFKWKLIGGRVDQEQNTVVARISQLGIYAVVSAGPIAPEDRRPAQKIITPNGDNQNDTAFFSFGGLFENVMVEIFDVTGHRVKTLMSSINFEWDGRNDSGEIVESGVYIYQYQLEGKRISGLIAVAK